MLRTRALWGGSFLSSVSICAEFNMTSEGSMNKPIKVVIIGGAGNVGRGICTSCAYNSEWQVIGVDPNFKQSCDVPSNEMNNIDTIPSCIEDVDTTVFQSWFISKDGDGGSTQKQHVEFIVTNDDGNRDNYTKNSNLGHDNNVRFEMLVKRIADTRDQVTNYNKNNVDDDNVSVHISYIGGSWTRLQPNDDKNVNELSPVKEGGGSNPYEIAKTGAEQNAQALSTMHSIGITFYDYISIVPNYASNFSINRMVRSGIEGNVIKYSPGDYGRPLLHSVQAGEFVAKVIEKQILDSLLHTTNQVQYETIVVPGHFVSFETFADIAKEVIDNRNSNDDGHATNNITFETYGQTPDELRTRCTPSTKGIEIDISLIKKGLKESAVHTLKQNTDS